jgi:hypothetical protein
LPCALSRLSTACCRVIESFIQVFQLHKRIRTVPR